MPITQSGLGTSNLKTAHLHKNQKTAFHFNCGEILRIFRKRGILFPIIMGKMKE